MTLTTSFGFMETAMIINWKQAKKLASKIVVDPLKEEYYKIQQETISCKGGQKTEDKILSLLPFLEGNLENLIALPGSALDVETKADIVARFTDISLAFQVKTSEYKAKEHLCKTCFLNGRKIAPPGVFWVSEKCHPFLLLKGLSNFLGIPIKKELLEILPQVKKLRGKKIPLIAVKFTPSQFHMLKVLALVRIKEDFIQF
ncbi:MAG: hypothetical protein EBR67_09975 [Proteobacteria bacterium]|nr:hypothetical protein [Pseudomonadota bacterium]